MEGKYTKMRLPVREDERRMGVSSKNCLVLVIKHDPQKRKALIQRGDDEPMWVPTRDLY